MRSGVVLIAVSLVGSGCSRSKKPIVIGSKDTTEQTVLGEVVAQHLEHRLGRKVLRNPGFGNTAAIYQALLNGEIGIYPEETGTLEAAILKEAPASDASATLERVRNELRRNSLAEVMDPLGIDDTWVLVVKKEEDQIDTLTGAKDAKPGWKLGVTQDFHERNDGLAALNQYRLPMSARTFVGDTSSLYGAMQNGLLTMVVGNAADWQLARNPGLKVLRDDKKVFGFYQTCLLVRLDLLANDPKIQPALAELSGRITNADMQRLDAEVVVDHKKPALVAAEFLTHAGLK
jgi:osmoprotectant transport system substrate-binding protein